MSEPLLRIDIKGGKAYAHPITGQQVPSVTTVLDVVNKPALKWWAAKVTAEFAVGNKDAWTGLPDDAAIKLLKGEPSRAVAGAAGVGTDAHEYCERILRGQAPQIPSASKFASIHGRALENVRALIDHVKPTPVALEATAWSEHGYAGSFDGLHIINEKLTLVDLKTSKGVYPDMALQLAAYRFADHILDEHGNESPLAALPIEACQIWHTPKEGTWNVYTLTVDTNTHNAFLAALALWHWKNTQPKAIRQPK